MSQLLLEARRLTVDEDETAERSSFGVAFAVADKITA